MSDQDQPTQRIRITEDDVSTPEVSRRVEEMAQAQKVALVRTVGDAPARNSGAGAAILTLTIGGATGGLLAFLGIKLLDAVPGVSDALSENSFLSNMSFTFMLAVFIGAGVSLADVVMNKSWAKFGSVAAIAVPAAIGAAIVMGLVAHLFYSASIEWLYNSVIDKVSTDRTLDLCRELETSDPRFQTRWLPQNRNVVDAYINGFREALAGGHEIVIEMDGGLSHDPRAIPAFLRALNEGNDCAFGSRYINGGSMVDSPLGRRFLSKGGTWLAKWLLGARLADMTSGYQAFRRAVLLRVGGADVIADKVARRLRRRR